MPTGVHTPLHPSPNDRDLLGRFILGGCLWEMLIEQGCLLELKSNWKERIIKKGGVLARSLSERKEFTLERKGFTLERCFFREIYQREGGLLEREGFREREVY